MFSNKIRKTLVPKINTYCLCKWKIVIKRTDHRFIKATWWETIKINKWAVDKRTRMYTQLRIFNSIVTWWREDKVKILWSPEALSRIKDLTKGQWKIWVAKIIFKVNIKVKKKYRLSWINRTNSCLSINCRDRIQLWLNNRWNIINKQKLIPFQIIC